MSVKIHHAVYLGVSHCGKLVLQVIWDILTIENAKVIMSSFYFILQSASLLCAAETPLFCMTTPIPPV